MLTNEMQLVLNDKGFNKSDRRSISSELKTAFIKGKLKEFRLFVEDFNSKNLDHEKLAVQFRGNNNRLIIYRNNHKLWDITPSGNGFKVSFDFNHARYDSDWQNKLKELIGMGYEPSGYKEEKALIEYVRSVKSKGKTVGGTIGTISVTDTKTKYTFDKKFVESSFDILKECIDSFFKASSGDKDQFKEVVRKNGNLNSDNQSKPKIYVEKLWQQRLYWYFKNYSDGYYVYDLEFSQKFPACHQIAEILKLSPKKLPFKAEDIKKRLGTNEPDMLAIRFENGEPKALVLMEVKSTDGACQGKSGIKKHVEGMRKYAEQKQFIANRIDDAKTIFEQYYDMGIIDKLITIPDTLKVELMLILTNANAFDRKEDNAIDYYKNKRRIGRLNEIAKGNNCEIRILEGDYDKDNQYLKLSSNLVP